MGKGRKELRGGREGKRWGRREGGEKGVGELGWWGKEESREFKEGGNEAGRWLSEGERWGKKRGVGEKRGR